MLIAEWVILSVFLLDLAIEIVKEFSFILPYDSKLKIIRITCQVLIVCVLFADLINQQIRQPNLTFRFGRFLRPFLSFFFIKLYYQQLKSIIKSFQEVLILVLFYTAVNWTMAFLCTQLFNFPDFQAEPSGVINYSNFWDMSVMMYTLTGFDGYPFVALPAIKYSQYYLLIFVTQMMAFQVFLTIIPTSLIFLSFKDNLGKIFIENDIVQKENLLIAFCCLDFNGDKTISYEMFSDFILQVYKNDRNYKYRIYELFSLIKDPNGNKKIITLNEFMKISSIFEKFPRLEPPILPYFEPIYIMRKFLNQRMMLSYFISNYIELLMIVVVIVDVVLVIVQAPIWAVLLVQVFFLVEVLLKVASLGLNEYLFNDWNNMDLMIVICTWSLRIFAPKNEAIINSIKLFRLLRIVKLFKILEEFVFWR